MARESSAMDRRELHIELTRGVNGVDGMGAAWREVDEGALFMADDRRDACL